jgi:hypothetical protein
MDKNNAFGGFMLLSSSRLLVTKKYFGRKRHFVKQEPIPRQLYICICNGNPAVVGSRLERFLKDKENICFRNAAGYLWRWRS